MAMPPFSMIVEICAGKFPFCINAFLQENERMKLIRAGGPVPSVWVNFLYCNKIPETIHLQRKKVYSGSQH
jgi:hypothetical protein